MGISNKAGFSHLPSRLSWDEGAGVGSTALAAKAVHFASTTDEAGTGFQCEFMEGSYRVGPSAASQLHLCLRSFQKQPDTPLLSPCPR